MPTQLSGGGIRSFIAKHNIETGLVDTYNTYRPDIYQNFVGAYYNTQLRFIHNKLLSIGYTEDTLTFNRSYLICFYDTNTTLSHYFAFPTHMPNGCLFSLTYSNNFFYVSGFLNNAHRPFLLKVDTLGNKIFEIPYVIGASEANTEVNVPQSIIVTDSADILIVFYGYKEYFGYPDSHRKVYKTIMIKTDTLGHEKWRWIDTSNNGQAAYSFQKTSDGGYISCGSYIGYRAFNDTDDFCLNMPYLVKWNSDFSKQWERTYTAIDVGYRQGELYDVKELPDGCFIACGYYSEGSILGYLIKVDADGNKIWEKQYRTFEFPHTYVKHHLYDLDVLPNGDIIAVGEVNPFASEGYIPQQGWLLRVDSNGCVVDSNWCGLSSIEVEPYTSMKKNNELKIFPNPANDIINLTMDEFENLKMGNIKVEVYDAMGRSIQIDVIQKETSSFREMSHQINISKLVTGLYFVRVIDNENKPIGSGKFVKE